MLIFVILTIHLGAMGQPTLTAQSEEITELTKQQLLNREGAIVKQDGKILRVHLYDESVLRPSLKKFIGDLRKAVAKRSKGQIKSFLSDKLVCHPDKNQRIEGVDACFEYLNADSKDFWKRLSYVLDQGGCFTGGPRGEGAEEFTLPSVKHCLYESHIELEKNHHKKRGAGPFFFMRKTKLYERPDINSRYLESQSMDAFYELRLPPEICPQEIGKKSCVDWKYYESHFDVKGFVEKKGLRLAGGGEIIIRNIGGKWQVVRLELWPHWEID